MHTPSLVLVWVALSTVEIQTAAEQLIKWCKGFAEDPTFHSFEGNFSKCSDTNFMDQVRTQSAENYCVPKDVVVELKTGNGVYSPNYVTVKRCVGHCKSSNHCLVESENTVYIPVKRKDRNDDVECGFVEVANHTKCSCGCQITPHDCNIYQELDQSACKCKCAEYPDVLERRMRNCDEKRGTWDYDQCRCRCNVKKCMPGTEWASERCECVEIVQ